VRYVIDAPASPAPIARPEATARPVLPEATTRLQARWLARAGILGLAVATAVALRLASVVPEVPNRHALIDDATRRVLLDIDAADSLRGGELFELLHRVVGCEPSSTVRALVAAPVHALAGPGHALGVELGVSLAFTALLFLVLGLAARCIAASTSEAILVLAISTLTLLGNRDLLSQAANGTQEVPSAVFTLAMAAAWLASRSSRTFRPWGVVIFGLGLFLVRFEYGLMLGLAVLLVEASEAGVVRPPRAALYALLHGARSAAAVVFLALAVTVLLGGWWLARSGGLSATVFRQEVSLHGLRGPVAFGAFLLLVSVECAFWQERVWLAAEIPRRARFLWNWLLAPMIVLTIVTSRLQIFASEMRLEVDQLRPEAIVERIVDPSRAAWAGWFPPDARWIVVAMLGASLVASWRSGAARRVLLALGALVLFQVTTLAIFQHGNVQPRLILNLAPLVALAAVAWVPAVPRNPRAVLSIGVITLLLWTVSPLWGGPELVATLSRGFGSATDAEACREVARALPITRGVLVNETGPERLQICALWVKLLARERAAQVLIGEPWTRRGRHEVLVLEDGTVPTGPRDGLVPQGTEARSGPLRGQRYRAEGL
jgi:hypothetical protein